MDGKPVLTIAIVLILGIIVLPSTISLFAGQHDWYNIDAARNQIPCEKCHADVLDELNNSPYHIKQGNPCKSDNQDCIFCHRVNSSITYAKGDGAGSWVGREAHAASTIQCMYCHGPRLYGAPRAGGFGLTNDVSDTGTYAAHLEFVQGANLTSDILLGENEACIACHTHVAVRINWSHAVSLEFNATDTGKEWATENYNTNGSAVRIVWGNAAGTGGMLYNGTVTISWGTSAWP